MSIRSWLGKLIEPDPYWTQQAQQQNYPQTNVSTNKMNSPYQSPNSPQTPNTTYSPPKAKDQNAMEVALAGTPYRFFITHEAQSRFNEYARAALFVNGANRGSEIGGLARVKRFGNDWVCTDIKIFEQEATAGYFELDDMAVARFMMELHKDGRDDEIPEWCSLIHSHPPNCAPFLSGPDEENIKRLGHGRFAWSIIATANEDTSQMHGDAYKVHFFTDGEIPILVKKMPVMTIHPDRTTIEEEVKTLIKKPAPVIGKGWGGGKNKPVHHGNVHVPSASPAPVTVKQGAPAYNFDVEATGIHVGDTIKVELLPNSLEGCNKEEVKVLTAMNGNEFGVVDIDPNGFVVNGVILLPSEVTLVATAAPSPQLTLDAPAEPAESDSEATEETPEAEAPAEPEAEQETAEVAPTAGADTTEK